MITTKQPNLSEAVTPMQLIQLVLDVKSNKMGMEKEKRNMTIREEVNRQIKHIESKITDMQAFNPYKTKDSINAMYWCGRQTASTTVDFIDTLQSLGMITTEEHAEYSNRISNLNNLLVKVHNEMSK